MDELTTLQNQLIVIEPQLIDRNPCAIYLAGLQPTGRRSQKQVLEIIAGLLTDGKANALSLDWSRLRFQHTQAIRARLAEMYKPATTNKALCALRGVLRAAWQLGLMTAENYQLAATVKSVKGSTLQAGRELTAGELAALMAVCGNDLSAAGVRDGAIVALMYAGGLRRDEVVHLDLKDFDPVTFRLTIRGKGNKERTTFLTNGAADAMADWLSVRGIDAGPLFWPINKGGKLHNQQMTNPAIYHVLQKRAAEAGVKSFSPHDLRRTFVSDLLDSGADITTVSKMAGHASVVTTSRYDRRPEEAKRKAAGLLHVPYHKRS